MDVVLPAQNFVPRWYQLDLWNAISSGQKKRAVICWPRRHGKDRLCLHLMANGALMSGNPNHFGKIGNYVYVMPYQNQARRIIWNGIDSQGLRFLHSFPQDLWSNKNESEMFIRFKNGSTFQVLGGDDPDKLVGANPVGVVFSEYALTNPRCWQLIAPILIENDGWVVFNSTPRGMNHFRRVLDNGRSDNKRWYADFQTAKTLKVLDPEQLRELRKELMDEALFQQEAMCSFEAPMQGSYYATQFRFLSKNKRITKVPIEPTIPVQTGWDLGMDAMSIWFLQVVRKECRLVHYYENSGEGMPFYARYLRSWAAENNATYGTHWAPHDINVRELMGEGKTRLEAARELGIKFRMVKKHSVEDGIEATRNFLNSCWFDEDGCIRGVDALKNYRKEWDAERNCFKSRPLHDWSSHGADAIRTLAMGVKRRAQVDESKIPREYNVEYSVFG